MVCREWAGETKRGNPLATIKTSIRMLHSFLLLTPGAVAFEGQTEIVQIVLSFPLCSSWRAAGNGEQWGTLTGHGSCQFREQS